LVTDASEGITEQDARLANHAWERGRALVLVINKSDLMPRGRRAQLAFSRRVEEQFPSLALVTKVYVSARSGYGIDALWAAIEAALASHRTRIPTPKLNQTLMRAVQQQAPPMVKGRRPRFLYATQTGTAPPTVTIFTSRPGAVQAAYERYLVHQLRTAFGCVGTPIRLRFRARQRRAGVVADER
jgi:GTP-binding protein